ncbi:MAG TPA: hypothetical protein DCL48_10725 [Alphaproteobacteria bacterium]|nr:hypothetical protein [Alphaproteobacteria bacterium]
MENQAIHLGGYLVESSIGRITEKGMMQIILTACKRAMSSYILDTGILMKISISLRRTIKL